MKLTKNQIIRVKIEGMNDLGNGVARPFGFCVFVTGAVMGDECEARVIKVTPGYAVARLEALISPSPYRVSDTCTAKGCGGCAYRLLDYKEELRQKQSDVAFAFRKAGLSDVTVLPTVSTGVTDFYRNKAQYPVANTKDGIVAGFYAAHSHRVVSAVGCPLQARTFSPIVSAFLDFMKEKGITAYDEESGTGCVRHLYLRTSRDEGAVLLTVVANADKLPFESEMVRVMTARFPVITGILLNTNKKRTNVVTGDRYRMLYGSDTLLDTLCGVALEIPPQSFYQVNHDAAELLYKKAAELLMLQGDETLLDLYCGVGSVGLSMAHRVKRLIGIEIVPEAIEYARKNAERNGIKNAAFFCGDAKDAAKLLSAAESEIGEICPDAVVLDPPRKGCSPALIEFVASQLSPPKIAYISCNPDTLARDCALFCHYGYTIGDVTPVDLFPRTGHVESVVCLTRQTN